RPVLREPEGETPSGYSPLAQQKSVLSMSVGQLSSEARLYPFGAEGVNNIRYILARLVAFGRKRLGLLVPVRYGCYWTNGAVFQLIYSHTWLIWSGGQSFQ
ncbi:MAG: hypothetical protein ACK2T3_06725, partial [Candidatus Promineifilaceae bacterium]